MTTEKNKLYYGDNFDVLMRYVKDETVDLVYLDPPFNSRQDYNVLRLYFHDDDSGQSKQVVFSVKAGNVTVNQVRDLAGVLGREKAEMGVFLTFDEPTKPMVKEAAEAGLYKSSDGTTYPRLQILTIQQVLDGKQPQYPLHRRDATFKKAPRSRPAVAENLMLPLMPGEG